MADKPSDPAPPNGNYHRARSYGGLLLLLFACVGVVIDALSPDWSFEMPALTLFVVTGTVLLGVEPVKGLLK